MFEFADPRIKDVLPEMVDLLFQELRAYGILHINQKLEQSEFDKYFNERIVVIRFIFEALSVTAGLRFSKDSRFPFIYNLSPTWSNDLPIAGYTNALEPRPDMLVASMISAWAQVIRNNSCAPRLLRAALWMIYKNDLHTAVTYLIDLLKNGFILNSTDLIMVLDVLFTIRACVASDNEIVEKIIGKKMGDDLNEWKWTDFQVRWSDHVENAVSKVSEKAMRILFEQTLGTIEDARNAESSDEWLLSKMIAEVLTFTVLDVVNKYKSQFSPATLSILSQLEEIEADVPLDSYEAFHFRSDFEPYRNMFEVKKGLSVCFKDQLGEGWEDRLIEARLWLPRQLKRNILEGVNQPLTKEWQYLSWKLAIPYSFWLKRQFSPSHLQRSKLFEIEEILNQTEIRNFFKRNSIKDKGIQVSIIKHQYYKSKEDSSQKNSLPSYSAKNFMKALSDAHNHLALDEIRNLLIKGERMRDENKYQEVIILLENLQELYPWSFLVFHDLALTLDMAVKPNLALKYVIPAIYINSTASSEWKLLSSIIKKLNNLEEFRYIQIFENFFERREMNQPKKHKASTLLTKLAKLFSKNKGL